MVLVIQPKFEVSFIDPNFFSIRKFRKVEKNDSLLFLKKLDFIKSNHEKVSTGVVASVAYDLILRSHAAIKTELPGEFIEKLAEKFRKSGKIEGYEFLNLSTFNKVWVSYYDYSLFGEENTILKDKNLQ